MKNNKDKKAIKLLKINIKIQKLIDQKKIILNLKSYFKKEFQSNNKNKVIKINLKKKNQ